MLRNIDRRDFILVVGGGLLNLAPPIYAQFGQETPRTAKPGEPVIRAYGSYGYGVYYFEPAGLFVEVGTTVQWAGVGRRSVAAYHPSSDNHELRIPETANPFDSSKTATTGGVFQWKFEVEGTYDYYCQEQESLGMVGRIVVGRPGGPGEKPPGYGNREGRSVMYPDAARLFQYLKSDEIVRKKSISYPIEMFERRFPWR